jgi:O-antigen/teichoic acid export membrane protein
LLLGSEIASRALNLFSMLIVARVLGPTALGQLAVAQAVVAYVSVLGDGGLTTLTQRTMVREPRQAERLATTTTSIQLALSTLLVIALLGVSAVLPVDQAVRHLVIVLSPLLVVQALNLFYILQAREQIGVLAIVRTLGQTVVAGLSVALVIVTNSNTWVAVAIWTGALLADALCFGALHSSGFHLRLPDWDVGKHLLKNGWPYLGMALLSQVLTNFDVLVLGATRSSREVGEYSAAYRIFQFTIGLVGLVVAVTFPEMVRRFRDDPPAFSGFVTTLIRQSTRVGYALTALVAVTAPEIISILYGAEYRQSGSILALLFMSVPLAYTNSLLGQGLLAAGRERGYLANIAVTAAVTIAALLVLVPRYGAEAASLVVLAGEFVTLALFTLEYARHIHVFPARELVVQLPWLVVPVFSLWVLTAAWHSAPLYVEVAVWFISLLVLELASGRQFYRESIGLGRDARGTGSAPIAPPSQEG